LARLVILESTRRPGGVPHNEARIVVLIERPRRQETASRRRKTSICIACALSKRAAAVANAAIRRSVAKPLSSVPSMAIDAACVQDEGHWTKLQINRPAVSFVLAPHGRSISKIPTN